MLSAGVQGGLNDGLLHRLPHEDPQSLLELYPGLPPALERVVMRALEKSPDKRFQNLEEMRTAIVEAQSGPQIQSRQEQEEERTIMIPRAGATGQSTGAPGVPSTGMAGAQPPATNVSIVSVPQQFGEASSKPETPFPRTQGLQLKKEAAAATRSASTVTKPASSTMARHATVVPTSPSQTAGRAPSRKWILVGSIVGALVIAAAAAIPWLTATPPNVMEQERPGIEAVMERFRTAYRNRNLEGVAEVFPTLPRETRQTMQRSFSNCLVYEVTFADMQVEINPADATLAQVDVRSTHTCTPNSGGRQTTTAQRDVYTLRKSGATWLIDSASRAPDASADASADRTQ